MHLSDAIPEDLRVFLAAGGTLEYDPATCDAGKVSLRKLDELRRCLFSVNCDETEVAHEDPNADNPGSYLVEGVDLVREADGGYGSEGLLIWLPLDGRYAAWDSSHNRMFVFDTADRWGDIAHSPARYLNAQWEVGDFAPFSALRPWINHTYNREEVYRCFPLPADWLHVEQLLRGKFVDGKQVRTPRKIRIELNKEDDSVVMRASMSHMDGESNWVEDQAASRLLSPPERAELHEKVRTGFWDVAEPEVDYGETVAHWSMEGFDGKRYRSLWRFYSASPRTDDIADLGVWILGLAGIQPLESFMG